MIAFFYLQNGKTALHFAAYKGQLSSVKALAEAGADLDLTDEVIEMKCTSKCTSFDVHFDENAH